MNDCRSGGPDTVYSTLKSNAKAETRVSLTPQQKTATIFAYINVGNSLLNDLLKYTTRIESPVILKLGMQHRVLEFYKVHINDDLALPMTYFTARSKLAAYAFEWKKYCKAI